MCPAKEYFTHQGGKLSYRIPTRIYSKDELKFPQPSGPPTGYKVQIGTSPLQSFFQEDFILPCEGVAHSETPKGTSVSSPVPNSHNIVTFTPNPWDVESSGFAISCQPI